MDSQANIEWSQTFSGIGDEWGDDVKQSTDGGYIISGGGIYWIGGSQQWEWYSMLIKTDGQGNLDWKKEYEARSAGLTSVVEDDFGNFVAAGGAGGGGGDGIVKKVNSEGSTVWELEFGSNESDGFRSINKTIDGSFILGGTFGSPWNGIGAQQWLLKINSNGTEEWQYQYGSHNGFYARQTNDGGYILSGNCIDCEGNNAKIIKTDSYGMPIWNRIHNTNTFKFIDQVNDGGYIALSGGMILTKTDNNGYTLSGY